MNDQPMKTKVILHTDYQRMMQDFDRARKGYINIGALIQCDITNRVLIFDPNVNTLEKWEIPVEARQLPKQIRFIFVPMSFSLENLAGMMADEVDDSRVLPAVDQMRERIVLEISLLKTRMQNHRKAIEKRNAK